MFVVVLSLATIAILMVQRWGVKNQLGTQIHQLKKSNDKIFSALASTASRLDAVERVQADADMRVRNLEIKMKSMSGAKNKDIAVEYDLSEGRVSQIINQ
jgi:Tfp pilus assembly major pilin PilA